MTRLLRSVLATLSLAVALPLLALAASGEGSSFDTTRVGDGVYTFRWNQHRNMFVVTDEGVIVTDPLNPPAARALADEIRKVTDQPVRYVVYSHQHWDHVLGGTVFKQAGATFVSHERCLPHWERRPNPDLVLPDLTFGGPGYDLELGGRTLELRYFGPNHGDCLIAMRLVDERILFLVDLASPGAVGFRILPDYQPLELIRSLEEIEQRLDFDLVVPGHLDPTAPPELLTTERGFYEDLMAAVGEAWEAGVRDPGQLVREIRLPKYETWVGYEEWLPLNVERAWAYYHMGW